jgi:hypothetical protein
VPELPLVLELPRVPELPPRVPERLRGWARVPEPLRVWRLLVPAVRRLRLARAQVLPRSSGPRRMRPAWCRQR